MAIVVLLLGAFMRPPPRSQWPRLAGIALFTGVLHFGTSFLALKLAGNLSSPAIVTQTYVPMAMLLAWWWLGERFAWRTALGITLSFAGVLVRVADGGGRHRADAAAERHRHGRPAGLDRSAERAAIAGDQRPGRARRVRGAARGHLGGLGRRAVRSGIRLRARARAVLLAGAAPSGGAGDALPAAHAGVR